QQIPPEHPRGPNTVQDAPHHDPQDRGSLSSQSLVSQDLEQGPGFRANLPGGKKVVFIYKPEERLNRHSPLKQTRAK
ncbi:Hypothetical predicted protein, partial [Marmota monax]